MVDHLATVQWSQAHGDAIVVDQENLVGTLTNLPKFSGAGQSFTPSFNSISVAEFVFAANSASLMMTLYQGNGIGGTTLGTSAPVPLSGGTFQIVRFDLLSPVNLIPGQVYTLFVSALGCTVYNGCSNGFGQEFSNNNPYLGGEAFDANRFPNPQTDLIFIEGTQVVPEPGTVMIFGSSLVGFVVLLRRRLML